MRLTFEVFLRGTQIQRNTTLSFMPSSLENISVLKRKNATSAISMFWRRHGQPNEISYGTQTAITISTMLCTDDRSLTINHHKLIKLLSVSQFKLIKCKQVPKVKDGQRSSTQFRCPLRSLLAYVSSSAEWNNLPPVEKQSSQFTWYIIGVLYTMWQNASVLCSE